jgi:prolyl-tRNA synthetase
MAVFIHSYLVGLKVIKKIEEIIRQEMEYRRGIEMKLQFTK